MNSPLFRLLPYIKQHALPFWAGMAGLLLNRILEAFIPLLIKQGVDSIAEGAGQSATGQIHFDAAMDALVFPCIAIIMCVIAQMLVTVFSRIMIRRIGMAAAYDLRNRIYDHLQKQGPGFFARYSIGDLMARAINDISLVRMTIAGATRMTLVLIFTAVVGLIFMFNLSVELTLMLLVPMPIITFVARRFSTRIYDMSQRVQQGFSELSTFVQENLNGIRTVQAMAQEQQEVKRFEVVNQRFADYNLDLFTNASLLGAYMPILASAGTLIIIGYGSHLVTTGSITLGTFVAFFSYLGMLLWPVREVGSLVTQWQRGASATQRLFEILDTEPEIQDQPSSWFPQLSGHISFHDVYYQYEDKDKYALKNINIEIEAGETIAILGRVGSGKSTLLRLLVRLLEPTRGEILLNGHPINHFPLATLREHVCMVLQDPFLFADSLGDNIAYDNPNRTTEEIWNSAQAAGLTETIENFPEGLGTILGERGVTLSGGQKQRAALARGLIRETPILILDDCFSAVDTETEEHILSGLKALRDKMTTLIVSHRVSTARHADRIIVLDESEIVETGTHAELLAANGFYSELERAQSQYGRMIKHLDHETVTQDEVLDDE